MKAMVFAAGLGTRLRPLTAHCPKALVEVGGVPMLERVILRLKHAGFDRIVVNVHHFPDMIIDFLKSRDNYGIEIEVSDERDGLLDTGGALVKARALLGDDEPVLVHNADILTDIDLGIMMKTHIEKKAAATLLVAHRTTSRYLLFDKAADLHGWMNVKSGETIPEGIEPDKYGRLAFGGVHVISPQLLDRMVGYRPKGAFPIMPFYLSVCHEEKINGYIPSDEYHWFDIGKPDTLAAAESYLAGEKN